MDPRYVKTVTLSANSVPSREEWVKAIRKINLKAWNMGDSVKVIDLVVFNFPFFRLERQNCSDSYTIFCNN